MNEVLNENLSRGENIAGGLIVRGVKGPGVNGPWGLSSQGWIVLGVNSPGGENVAGVNRQGGERAGG